MRRRELISAGALVAMASCVSSGYGDETTTRPARGNEADTDPSTAAETEPATEPPTDGGRESERDDDTGTETATDRETEPTTEEPRPALSTADAQLGATEVEAGRTVTASVTVANEGDAAGERTVALAVDGDVVAETSVTVDAGASERVSLEWTPEDPGEYDVSVGGVVAGTLAVRRPESAFAQDHIDAAQRAFEEAIDSIEARGHDGESFGTSLDATARGMDTPTVYDALQETVDEVAAAREYETTDRQRATLGALEAVATVVEGLMDARPPLFDLYDGAVDLISGFEAWQSVDGGDLVDYADEFLDELETAESVVETAEAGIDHVDALDSGQVVEQYETFRSEALGVRSVASAVGPLSSAHDGFWETYEAYHSDEPDSDAFAAAKEDLDAARDRLETRGSPSLDDEILRLACYANGMRDPAWSYQRAAGQKEIGDEDAAEEHEADAEAALDDVAAHCALYEHFDLDDLRA